MKLKRHLLSLLLIQLTWFAQAIMADAFDATRSESVDLVNSQIASSGGINRLYEDARRGDPEANYLLGQMYRLGIVKKRSFQQAVNHFDLAAKQDHNEAIFMYGLLTLCADPISDNSNCKIQADSFSYIEKSAILGNSDAQLMMGKYSLNGMFLRKDNDVALFWINKSAAQKNKMAQTLLLQLSNKSDYYLDFDSVRKDAVLGDPNSMVKLAQAYANGWVVERNLSKAKMLYDLALKNGATRTLQLNNE